MTVQVSYAFPGDGVWDAYVREQPTATHSHLSGWRTVIQRVFGHECLYLSITGSDARLTGVLPLVRVRSRVFGHYLVSMPFLNSGGPIGEETAVRVLAHHAASLAVRNRARLLELRCTQPLPVDLDVSHRKITVVLDTDASDSATLWNRLPSKVRSQVRRPQREGISVQFGADQLDAFYRVFSHHMRDLGTPAQPRALFESIAETFPEDALIGAAYHKGRPVAAGFAIRWRDQVEMTWASSLRAFNHLSPNMLLYWSFMERAVSAGVRRFDFGRCSPDSATHRFKRQWGARDVPLWWYQATTDATRSTPAPSDARYTWGTRLWRRLPLPIATALGPSIVRYIP